MSVTLKYLAQIIYNWLSSPLTSYHPQSITQKHHLSFPLSEQYIINNAVLAGGKTSAELHKKALMGKKHLLEKEPLIG